MTLLFMLWRTFARKIDNASRMPTEHLINNQRVTITRFGDLHTIGAVEDESVQANNKKGAD